MGFEPTGHATPRWRDPLASSAGSLRLALFVGLGAAFFAWRSPGADAHDHGHRHVAWPNAHPVYDHNEQPVPQTAQDRTFLVKPIRVDLDEFAPGPHEVRAVRLHVRALERGGREETIAWERPMFPSDEAMLAFKRRLEPLMPSPIVSLRVRVIQAKDSPEWNKRWRATEMPYWAEIPVY